MYSQYQRRPDSGLSSRPDTSAWGQDFTLVEIKSPSDGAIQNAYFYKSGSYETKPLIVQLHSWTYDYRQFDSVAVYCRRYDLNFIHPDFRGPNNTKNACCSDLVISDIDAAIDYAIKYGNVDTSRIFVLGQSGGGYATLAMFMKSKHRIRKFSAWVPISDLVRWYDETSIRELYYAQDILKCTNSTGNVLNLKAAIQKSPIYWETPVGKLKYSKLEIYAGIYDGLENNGPIPITQSINFYNKILSDLQIADSSRYVSDSEKLKLLEFRKPLNNYGMIGGRDVCLIKEVSNIRLIIFRAKHEMLIKYAIEDLLRQ
jgi:hypothetical protein